MSLEPTTGSPSVRETTSLLPQNISITYGADGDSVTREWLDSPGLQANEESIEVVRSASNVDGDAEEGSSDNEDTTRDGPLQQFTRRLRCLFSAITWPIVPLGTIVTFALLWLLYAAFILDLQKSCSSMHWYAFVSFVFVSYAPHHAQVRSYLFRYTRERDGPVRPAAVRMYDQLFHTLCILYVYGGVTLIQSCRDETGTPPTNMCAANCPSTYQALNVYVTTLELFTIALILPLVFLPCVYVWIIRRAATEADAFSQLQERLEEEEALLISGGFTAQEIMDSLERVKLVSRNVVGTSESQVVLLSLASSPVGDSSFVERDGSSTRECCICMSEFEIQKQDDIETGTTTEVAQDNNVIIVRTKCGHVFHGDCLAGWIGGRWEPNWSGDANTDPSDRPRRRARRTCCPLCREDLKPSERTG